MANDNKVWIDPNGHALDFLGKGFPKREGAPQKRREEAEQRAKEYEDRQRRWKQMESDKE